ncbi:MAG: proton-conducting transporter membrane subunit [Gaiella sp.]|nr:proton-conducting transporter membrane subunit [Gaiella sp.]
MSFALLALTGLVAVGAGGLLAIPRRSFPVGLAVQAAGCLLFAVGGFWALVDDATAGEPFTSAFTPRVGIDALTGLFLGVLGVVGAASLVYATRYLAPSGKGRAIGALTALFVSVQVLVLVARDPLTFLVAWEAMTLVPAAVILVARSDEPARRAVFFYVALTHLAGAGTWVAILLLAREGAVGDPSAIASGSGVQVAIALAALVGMGAKAGLMPLHVWLPLAHPIAPAHVSALMSGVMIKIAIYALVRVLVEWLGVLPEWLAVLVLALGALSSVAGVVYALFQHELKRLLAFHSIENVGIIVLGLGACLLLRARGADAWAAFALAAALLHTVSHALFKSLLFLGAGSYEKAVGSLELDRLGGLVRRMPWTAGAFFVGAVAIAGLPPLNGFASEWTTLQSLLRVPAYGGVADGVAGAIALAALAATAALAALCFVKVIGLVLLGPARREAVAQAEEAPGAMRAAVVALASACVLLGIAPGLLFGSLVGLAPWSSDTPTTVGLDLPSTGDFRSGGVALALAALVGALALLRRRRVAVAAPTWACGQLVERQLEWTSAGFTKPLRLMLEDILRPERQVVVRSEGGVVREVAYEGRVPHHFEERLYRPVTALAMSGAHHARRVQGGRLGVYVAYLLGLVLVVLTAAKLGILG